jgi:hypothetical protein
MLFLNSLCQRYIFLQIALTAIFHVSLFNSTFFDSCVTSILFWQLVPTKWFYFTVFVDSISIWQFVARTYLFGSIFKTLYLDHMVTIYKIENWMHKGNRWKQVLNPILFPGHMCTGTNRFGKLCMSCSYNCNHFYSDSIEWEAYVLNHLNFYLSTYRINIVKVYCTCRGEINSYSYSSCVNNISFGHFV